MDPLIFRLFGPIAIQAYGVALLMGFMIFWLLIDKNSLRPALMNSDTLTSFLTYTVCLIIAGGRIGDILGSPEHYSSLFDMVAIWEGGLSILGATIAIALGAPLFLYLKNIPILPTLDLMTMYVPILHIFGRLGCFMAGCCHGVPTNVWWAITYTNPHAAAPLHIALHPTQLYSVALFMMIALILQFIGQFASLRLQPGTIALIYVLLASLERFCIDFLRGERNMIGLFSFHQWLALSIMGIATLGLVILWHKKRVCHGYF